jgi:hypothetical protein
LVRAIEINAVSIRKKEEGRRKKEEDRHSKLELDSYFMFN